MRLSEHEWKAARTIVAVTLVATTISFVSIWIWAQIDPVLTLRRCYEASIVMPLLIAPLISFGVQRAHLKVRVLSDENQYLAHHDELTESVARFWFEALVREVAFQRPGGHDVTVSLGWCIAQPDETVSALLNRADRALYASKAAGKNRAEKAERDMFRVVA